MEKMFYGPLWPMPALTIAAAGTGAALTSGLTAPTGAGIQTSEYFQAAAKGIIVSNPTGNDDVFLVLKGPAAPFFSKNNAGTVVAVIAGGSPPFQLPAADYGGNRFDMNQMGIDVTTNGDTVYVCGIME